MTFAQPLALWLLLALVVLWLVRRVPPRRQLSVGNLYLWTSLEERSHNALTHRLRRNRLPLLHAAFILLVVLALAQPQVAFNRHVVALVIDVSMSMGATDGEKRRIDRAAEEALVIARALPSGSRVDVYLAGAQTEMLGAFSSSDGALEERLRSVEPSDGIANLDAAVEQARSGEPSPASIFVLSDAKSAIVAADVDWVHIGGPLANVAINSFTAVPDFDAGAVSLVVGATNYGRTAVTGPVVISAGDRVLARRTISVPASDSASVAFSLPSVSGLLSARLDAADALEADNTRYALAPAAQTTRAVVFGSSPFLEKALAALPGVDVTAPIANEEPDLVICAGCGTVPQEYARAHVLLLPSASEPVEDPAPLIVTSHSHPLLALVDPSGLLVTPLSNGAALEESDVLMRAAGHPVLAAYTNQGRRVVEMRFDPSRSPLATHPAFPLLVAASVSWLSTDQIDWVSGEPIRLPAEGVTGVIGSDEQSIGYVISGDEVIVVQTTAAGLYRIATASGEASVVVNPASHVESDLSSPALTSTRTATGSARRSRGDVSWVLLLGALAVLAGEWRMQAGWRR